MYAVYVSVGNVMLATITLMKRSNTVLLLVSGQYNMFIMINISGTLNYKPISHMRFK